MPTNRRRWVAALLSLAQPGVGHLYLREWSRGVTWFLLWMATALFATGITTAPTLTAAGLSAFVDRFLTALSVLDPIQSLALAAVTGFAVVDAYWIAVRHEERTNEGPSCPVCGNEVDPELDFCHWCTTKLEWRYDDPRRTPDT